MMPVVASVEPCCMDEPPDDTPRICFYCEHFEAPFDLGGKESDAGVCRLHPLGYCDHDGAIPLPWKWADEDGCEAWKDAT